MEITRATFKVSSAKVEQCPKETRPEYAFIGRSNVGKSSLINMLTRYNKLAQTSRTPGKTALINHFLINESWYLVDLPGFGYAKRSKTEQQRFEILIRSYILQRVHMSCLFLLIDIRHAPQQIDLDFIEWLGLSSIPFAIVFTKADKLPQAKIKDQVTSYLSKLKEQWEELPPYFVTSAERGTGRTDLLEYIASINKTYDNETL